MWEEYSEFSYVILLIFDFYINLFALYIVL